MVAILSFVVGVAGLVLAASLLVRGASDLGIRLGLSPTVIGLTIVAAGTSAPELAVVGQAVFSGDAGLAVGGVVGSNIANVLLVLGVVATIGSVRVENRVVRVDVPIMISASFLLLLFALDNVIGRLESAALLAGIVAFTGWTIRSSRAAARNEARAIADAAGIDETAPPAERPAVGPVSAMVVKLVVGVAGLAVAARLVVSGAESIASSLGVSDLVIGLTVVAIGTSAPEIVTTIVAAVRGQAELAVGNAVGSNIYNILFVLGAIGVISPDGIAVSDAAVRLDLPVMIAAAIACVPVALDRLLVRWEGLVFLGYYLAYLAFLVLDAADHDATDSFVLFFGWIVVPLTVITFATVIVRHLLPSREPVVERT